MASLDETRLIHATHDYPLQAHQSKRHLIDLNGMRNTVFETHGSFEPHQCVDKIAEFVYRSKIVEKSLGSNSNHEQHSQQDQPTLDEGIDQETGRSTDLRKSFVGQWRCPALAWKAFEAMPVRNLFRVTQPSVGQNPSKDFQESFVKAGGKLLDADEGEKMSEKKVVTIVLAFQRWRHNQLKNIIGQELKKVLEEAREDEATLAALETELERTEQHLATAHANSTRLRSQLAAAISSSHDESSYFAEESTVSKSDRQMIGTKGRMEEAGAEMQRRDNEIQHLKDKLKNMEDQSGRAEQLNGLQADKTSLQAENSNILRENMALLEQLARRDEKMTMQLEEMERLRAVASRLIEHKNSNQKQIESIVAEHSYELKSIQEKLQQACQENSAKEVELATCTKRCSNLAQEKDTLLSQLQDAEKRADNASSRVEELQMQLQSTADDRAKSSAEVASEMVKHLKRLTEHVRELETTVNTTDGQPLSSSFRDGPSARCGIEDTINSKTMCADLNNRAALESNQDYYTSPKDPVLGLIEDFPMCVMGNIQDQRQVTFSPTRNHLTLEPSRVDRLISQHKNLDELKNGITWKWRWAASAARAEELAKKLHGFDHKSSEDSYQSHKQRKVEELMQRLRTENLTTCLEKELNKMVTEHKLVPLILSAWRAFARTSVLDRKTISRSALLDKVLETLPWWIKQVRERHQKERSFTQWQLLTLRTTKQQHPPKVLSNKHTNKERSLGDSRNQCRRAGTKEYPKTRTTPRALQALQTTLQQEVTELQKILSSEIQPVHCHSQNGRPPIESTKIFFAKDHQPDSKRALNAILGVCNNLALALTAVRSKLNPRFPPDTMSNANEQARTKLNRDTSNNLLFNNSRRQILTAQSPRNSPRWKSAPVRTGRSKLIPTWERWGTQNSSPGQHTAYQATDSRQPTKGSTPEIKPRSSLVGAHGNSSPPTTATKLRQDSSQKVIENLGLEKLCLGNKFSFQGHNHAITPTRKRARPQIKREAENTSNRDRCSTTARSVQPVQEIEQFVHENICNTSSASPREMSTFSTIKKILAEGLTMASLEEEKLIRSALARISSKISRIQGNQEC